MSIDPGKPRVWLLVLLVLVLGYLLFFHATGRRHIWQPDEDEYILVNREMVEDGHWIYPTFNGKPYSIKPPLFNWLGSGFAVVLGGVSELPSRLPSALAGLAGLFVLWRLGSRMFGGRAGFLAALILATTPLYIEFARWIQINMLSTVLNLTAMSLFWWGYTTPRKRGLAYILMYVPMGVGVLNMGLVNLVMPAIVIGSFLLVTRDLRHILALRIHWGILVVLAVAGPWYVTVCRYPEYRDNLLMVTNFDRFFTTSLGHTRPIWYYLRATPFYFLPWTLFLPSAVIALRTPEGEQDRKPLLFLMVWIAALFVFFSLSKTKRTEYLLPIYPAMALLAGYVIDRGAARGEHSGRWWGLLAWPARLAVGLLVTAGIGVAVWAGVAGDGWLGLVFPVAILLVAAGVSAGWFFRRGRVLVAVGAIAVAAALSVAWSTSVMIDRLNEEQSVVSFCENVADRFPEGEPVRQFRHQGHAYGYYLERPVLRCGRSDVLAGWLESPERIFVITKEKEFQEARNQLPEETYVIHRQWVDHRYVLLVSNQPD